MKPEAVKARLRMEGKSIKQWAEERGVHDYLLVCRLMNGFSKGHRGKAHVAAVALGLKENVEAL